MSSPYTPPAFSSPIELDLSRNEGRSLVDEIAFGGADAARLSARYPDTTRLHRLVAARHGMVTNRVLVTAGGDDALFRCFLATSGGAVVTTTPSFEMIRRYAGQVGTRLAEVPWWGGDFPLDVFLAAPERYMAVIVSPNNPTGSVIREDELRRVANEFLLVVLDAAYVEFADEDLTSAVLELGNVVMIRTLSKAYGLAGLRVGYALGAEPAITRIGSFGSPYPVSALSAELACHVLSTQLDADRAHLAQVAENRERLTLLLDELGCDPLPSQANFVLATDVDAPRLVEGAAALGVGLRRFPGRESLARCVRITVPWDEGGFRRLEHTLRSVFGLAQSEEVADVAIG